MLVGTGLALSPAPRLTHPTKSPSKAPNPAPARPSCPDGAGVRCFPMRDGALLAARPLASDGDLVVVYLHGIQSSAPELEESARCCGSRPGPR